MTLRVTAIASFLVVLSLSPALLLALDVEEGLSRDSHVARILESGELVMRCFPQQDLPFIRVNVATGPMRARGTAEHFEGIDIEVVSEVARRLGVELVIQPILEPKLRLMLDAVEEEDGDLAGGGLTITESRSKRFTFSRPYLGFYDVVLASSDRPMVVSDLQNATVAVLRGSSYHELISSSGIPPERLHLEDFNIGSIERLIGGLSDVTLGDSSALPSEVGSKLQVAFRFPEKRVSGYAMPLGSDLKQVFDQVLDELEETGKLQTILSAIDHPLEQILAVPTVVPGDFCGNGCEGALASLGSAQR